MAPRRAAAADRPAAIRRALREVVAERGFHGASMSVVARRAGVAIGTAYVHYRSKDDLVVAAYVETKRALSVAAAAAVDPQASPRERFLALWLGAHTHLRAAPDRARFLLQVDTSPYAAEAHARTHADDGDPLVLAATQPDMRALLVPLPPEVLYDLGLGAAVRLAAVEADLDERQLRLAAAACWAAITAAAP